MDFTPEYSVINKENASSEFLIPREMTQSGRWLFVKKGFDKQLINVNQAFQMDI